MKRCIVYDGEKAKEIAESLFPSDSKIDARNSEGIDQETDVLGCLIPTRKGSIPEMMVRYIENTLRERDNTGLGYIFAIIIPEGKKGLWTEVRISMLLASSGCVLSYWSEYDEKKKEEILTDIAEEKFKIAGHGPVFRIFGRKISTYQE